jgi:dTDP-glucose 4,6-dehydratase
MKRRLESLEDHTTFQESKDRLGHDWRQAIEGSKSKRELGWRPREIIGTGIRRSVEWYLANPVRVACVSGSEATGVDDEQQ